LLWTYALKIAVPMAILCERSPRGALAPHAYEQLHAIADFVYSAQNHHPRMAQLKATLNKLQRNAHSAISAVGPGPTSQLSYGEVSMSPDPPESEEASAYSGTSRIVHVADRKTSPQTVRSRPNTDSPKERTEQTFMNSRAQETPAHPVSSMRGILPGYQPPPTASHQQQFVVGSQPGNPPEPYGQGQSSQQTYYGDGYQSAAQYPAQQGYQTVPPYVIDSSGPSGGAAPSMDQYGANSMPYNGEYRSVANGMVNAAMRDYDLTWLDRFEPTSTYRMR